MIFHQDILPQKSDEWLKFRKNKVGTSEFPILTKKAPTIWCDDYELFLRKIGKPFTFSNKYTEVGDEFEPIARDYVIEYLKKGKDSIEDIEFCKNIYDRTEGIEIINPNFEQYTVQYKDNPRIFSSFDGIDIENKLVLEIKCPSEKTFTKILKNRKPTIPKMYYDQVQGQLLVANSHWGVTSGIFAVFFEEGVQFKHKKSGRDDLIKLILVKSELDLEYCQYLLKTANKFIEMVDNRKWEEDWYVK